MGCVKLSFSYLSVQNMFGPEASRRRGSPGSKLLACLGELPCGRQPASGRNFISHPMISFHAPISQTLTSLKRQHGLFLPWGHFYCHRAISKERDVLRATRPMRWPSCDALGSLLFIVSCYIVYYYWSIFNQIYNEICMLYTTVGDCIFSISRRIRKPLISSCPLPCEAGERSPSSGI